MNSSEVMRAVSAASSCASELGLKTESAVVLQNSNRLTVRLLPCDVLARVAPLSFRASAAFELEVARRLAEAGFPAAELEPGVEPRVYVRDGFAMNMWTYYEPVVPREVAPDEYAQALERLHAGMREIDISAPHFTDRVADAQRLVESRDLSPALADADRELLSDTLRKLKWSISQRGTSEQLLHGEPHPGNLLRTRNGLLFIDFETCCRGPVEFDVAGAPEEVGEHYAGTDPDLLAECRILATALVAAWRWDRDDDFPDGRQMGNDKLSELRAASVRERLDAIP